MDTTNKLVEEAIIATKNEMLKTHKPFNNSQQNANGTLLVEINGGEALLIEEEATANMSTDELIKKLNSLI